MHCQRTGSLWRKRYQRKDDTFFTAVAELARRKGFKIKGVQGGALTLTLNGEFAVMVDESGAINYHPYDEVFDIMDEVSELRKSIPSEETGQGMQMNV